MILNIFIMISLKKFEKLDLEKFKKLDLEKFKSEEFENSFLIFGGNVTDTTAPDGGYVCDTKAGTYTYQNGESFNYTADRYAAQYDPVTNKDVETSRDFNRK
jgi:hypothetical protein